MLLQSIRIILYCLFLDHARYLLNARFVRADGPRMHPLFPFYIELVSAYLYLFRDIDRRGSHFATRFQEKRLRRIISFAASSPWWRAYFKKHGIKPSHIRTLSDLTCIPPTDREVFSDSSLRIETRVRADDLVVRTKSSGSTTGIPMQWAADKELWMVDRLAHSLKEFETGQFSFKKASRKNFYAHFNYAGTPFPFQSFFGADLKVENRGTDIDERIKRAVQRMQKVGTQILRTSPSELRFLLTKLKELYVDPHLSFCTITGQVLEDSLRSAAEAYLHCPVRGVYGNQELARIGVECHTHRGLYHALTEAVVVEILSNASEPYSEDTGEITVTSLDNTYMPLIRYKTGDIGVFHKGKGCSCTSASPLFEVLGRSTDVIVYEDGSSKSPKALLKIIAQEPFLSKVRRVQIRQEAVGQIRILLEVKESLEDSRSMLMKEIGNVYGALKYSLEELGSIPQEGPKFLPFVPLKKQE